jgi:hypothetical protein
VRYLDDALIPPNPDEAPSASVPPSSSAGGTGMGGTGGTGGTGGAGVGTGVGAGEEGLVVPWYQVGVICHCHRIR